VSASLGGLGTIAQFVQRINMAHPLAKPLALLCIIAQGTGDAPGKEVVPALLFGRASNV
jgi:hypothetical protein